MLIEYRNVGSRILQNAIDHQLTEQAHKARITESEYFGDPRFEAIRLLTLCRILIECPSPFIENLIHEIKERRPRRAEENQTTTFGHLA